MQVAIELNPFIEIYKRFTEHHVLEGSKQDQLEEWIEIYSQLKNADNPAARSQAMATVKLKKTHNLVHLYSKNIHEINRLAEEACKEVFAEKQATTQFELYYQAHERFMQELSQSHTTAKQDQYLVDMGFKAPKKCLLM